MRRATLGVVVLLAVAADPAAGQLVRSPRWSIKVLNDSEAAQVASVPETTSVAALLRLPTESPTSASKRLAVERKTFRVICRVVGCKRELDGDLHVVIADTADLALRMTVEVPDSAGREARAGGHAAEFGAARRAIAALFRRGEEFRRLRTLDPPPLVEIVGVGFYDPPHYLIFKTTAPNNIELHPVLRVRRLPQ